MRIDMSGQTYGSLTVLKREGVYRGHDTLWLCKCACGNSATVRGSFLRNGHTKTCGHCIRYEKEADYYRCTVGSGRSFIFDTDDYSIVSQYQWSVSLSGYVLGSRNGYKVKLHQLLIGSPGMVVDHINGDPSDCRRINLRIATQHQNSYNSSLPKSSSTGYKGVCFDKRRRKYMAYIHPNGKMVFLGYYNRPDEAALAYDKAASVYFGKFAKLNYMDGEQNSTKNEEPHLHFCGAD